LKNIEDIKEFLEQKTIEFNRSAFIPNDPISIPHQFQIKEDIEISAFLTATISWGNRVSILKSAQNIMQLMDHAPFDFTINHTDNDLKKITGFVHRTFNATDLLGFIACLNNIYKNHGGLESVFSQCKELELNLEQLPKVFFSIDVPERSKKHLANICKGSAAKKINMFLRWMVRKDDNGVDFGIWKSIKSSQLFLPLDVHSGRVARELGLLNRKQNDWKSVVEVTEKLRAFDKNDPIKYDYALFGISAIKSFT